MFLEIFSTAALIAGAGMFVLGSALFVLERLEKTDDHTKLLKQIRMYAVATCFMVFGIGIKVLFL